MLHIFIGLYKCLEFLKIVGVPGLHVDHHLDGATQSLSRGLERLCRFLNVKMMGHQSLHVHPSRCYEGQSSGIAERIQG